MSRATILAVDDDPQVSRAIARDLRARYGSTYRVVRATSGEEALGIVAELALRAQQIALLVSDQRMPGMTGIELMSRVRETSPETRLLLLTAYADTDVAIRAINDIGLDYYMFKPWEPPENTLYPVVDDLLEAWRRANPDDDGTVRVIGHLWSDRSYDVKMFLARNHIPYRWLDLERDDEAQRLVSLAGHDEPADLPLVLLPDAEPLCNPSSVELAEALGLRTRAQQPLYDLCIVGGGPAGLAAAVYGASEGLRTVIVERDAPGGQAGQSAAIENYLGFPKGVSGADLTHRAVAQAARFGAETVLAREVEGLEQRGPVHAVRLADGGEVESRAVLIATGVAYRRLNADGVDRLGSRGVYYGASASEAAQTVDQVVHVVGAANSAGQAVLNFARVARKVVMLVRGSGLAASMSEYLIDRISASENVEVRFQTEVVAAHGDGHLESVTLVDRATGTEYDEDTNWLFVFIGALPRTDWLGDDVVRDAKGFLVTGPDLLRAEYPQRWPLTRPPFALETSVPGVFAAGDVRLDSMKRVASAVGEGAMSVYLVHRYLTTV
ncbi:response regulator [Nostocoides sp. F2B08]|uniref:FAD-dependent oxidoreductase n=1 Tax=Nostocoides sp. F2B08 TaxID=2653936 RepID=UPI00126331C1|nr:FAD-dependent oxidoreductase [Tetrasphaera sp. F2B08]KAB7740623.1 response regulator [Tetrasphaera sp. F2B08]